MKQKKRLIFLVMFLLVLPFVNAGVWIGSTYHEDFSNKSIRYNDVDWANSTAFPSFINDTVRVGYSLICTATGEEGSLPSCWNVTQGVTYETDTPYFGKYVKLSSGGGDPAMYIANRVVENFIMTGWVSQNWISYTDPSTVIGGRDAVTTSTHRYYMVNAPPSAITTSNGAFTNWKIKPNSATPIYNWLEVNNYENYIYLANTTYNESKSINHIGGSGHPLTYLGVVTSTGVNYKLDELRVWDADTVNLSGANIWQTVELSTSESVTGVMFSYTGKDVELNFSCDDGITWANINSNNSAAACSSGSGNKNLTLKWILTTETSHLDTYDVSLINGFSISAEDYYDGSSISNFTITLKNSTDTFINSTSSGSFLYPFISTGIYNITISSNQSGGYFNVTYDNYDVTTDLNVRMYQSILILNASEIISNNPISSFSATIPTKINYSNSTGLVQFIVKAGTYNVTGNASNYFNSSKSITISPLEVKTDTLEFASNNLTISAISIISSDAILSFNVSIYSLDYNYSVAGYTSDGNYTLTLINGSYNVTISPVNYTSQSAIVNFSRGDFFPNYTFSLYTSNSINFSFFDEETSELIDNATIDIEIIGDYSATNYSTSNGFLYVDLIMPSVYLIRFDSADYTERHYYFQLVNNTHNELKLYLVNDTKATAVTATVIDQDGKNVESAYVKVLRYEIGTNSYTVREIYKTDNQGETSLNIIKNNEFYKFMIEYPFGEFKLLTDPAYIISDTIPFQIQNRDLVAARFFKASNVLTIPSFNNDTNTFSLVWNDPNNVMSEICWNIYDLKISSKTLVNSSCVQSSSGTISLRVANQTGTTYLAEAIAGFSPTEYMIDSLVHTFIDPETLNIVWGPWIDVVLTLLMSFAFIWSAPIAVVLCTVPTLVLSMFQILSLDPMYAIALFAASIIVAAIIQRYSK